MTVPGGPRVVGVGGGHGLAVTLRAARTYASEIAAVVTVADDGGSSGRLRRDTDMPAPGDIRHCLKALAADDSPLTRAFEHRFGAGELAGHPLGNLLLAGLTDATGDFVAAVEEAARLVGAVGAVHPATVDPVRLCGTDGRARVEGEVDVSENGAVDTVWLEPESVRANPAAIDAVAGADQVVLGPGSLYTSVIAACAVPGLRLALAATDATLVYVCNLAEELPQTEGYSVNDHLDALAAHGIEADIVLCDPAGPSLRAPDPRIIWRSMARPHGLAHDASSLGQALADAISEPLRQIRPGRHQNGRASN